jgi:hypothetical protein
MDFRRKNGRLTISAADTRGPRLAFLRGADTGGLFFSRAIPDQDHHRGRLCPAKTRYRWREQKCLFIDGPSKVAWVEAPQASGLQGAEEAGLWNSLSNG